MEIQKYEYVSTGLLPVDIILSGRGILTGKIYEMYGQESIGKSTIPLQFAIEFTKQVPNSKIVYIDTEYAFDYDRFLYLGGNEDRLIYALDEIQAQKKSDIVLFSDIVNFINNLMMKNPEYQYFIIWDSIPATIEDTQGQVGSLARLLSQNIKVIRKHITDTKSVLWLINHIYSNISSRGNQTKGGRATKYYSDVRIEVKKKAEVRKTVGDDVDLLHSLIVSFETKKNKLFYSGLDTVLVLHSEKGLQTTDSLIEFLKEKQYLTKSGSWYRFNYEDIDFKFQNTEQFMQKTSLNPEIIDIINYLIVKRYTTISPYAKYKLLPLLNKYEKILNKPKTELTPEELEEINLIKKQLQEV